MTGTEHAWVSGWRSAPESPDEQARRNGARPFQSPDDLRNDEVWESDEDLVEFLAHLDDRRCAGRPEPMTAGAQHADQPRGAAAPESLAEQIRRKGISPLRSADELRDDDIWESDEELQEFLDQLYQARRSGLA